MSNPAGWITEEGIFTKIPVTVYVQSGRWLPLYTADHAEELAKLLARYIALVKEDRKYKSSAYGVWAKKTDIADQRILEGEALSVLSNYREATK